MKIVLARKLRRAVPALAAGAALFVLGCQTPQQIQERGRQVAAARAFELAEEQRSRGDTAAALKNYRAYLLDAPRGSRAAAAWRHMTVIHLDEGRIQEARQTLQQWRAAFPEDPAMADVRLRVIQILHKRTEWQLSTDEALGWLQDYPDRPERGDVLFVLGSNAAEMDDHVGAFFWWIKAENALQDDPLKREAAVQGLEAIIAGADQNRLGRIAEYAVGSPHTEEINYRRAVLLQAEGLLVEARETAQAVAAGTSDPDLRERALALLSRIEEERSVRRDRVGCLLPMSGQFAIYGEEILNGIRLALDQEGGLFPVEQAAQVGTLVRVDGQAVQTEGLVRSGQLEFVLRDTRGDPRQALTAVQELVRQEGVVAVIGPLASKVAAAVAPQAQEWGVPLITLTPKPEITELGDMVFRNFLTRTREVERLADAMTRERGFTRFGILYPENSYGRLMMNLFWDRLEEVGAQVTAVESYAPAATDFADQIRKMVGLYYSRPESVELQLAAMKEQERGETPAAEEGEGTEEKDEEPEPFVDFDAVFLPDHFQSAAMLAPQFMYHDVTGVQLMGTSLWQSPELIRLAGDYVQGGVFTAGFLADPEDACVGAFTTAYRDRHGAEPGVLAATGYDTIRLLRQVLQDPSIRTRRQLQQRLLQGPGIEGLTGRIAFDGRGEVQKQPYLLTIRGGRFEKWAPPAR